MIVAPNGRVFIGADYDQLELRILAAASGDRNLILRCKGADDKRKLEPEWDPHSYVAGLALGPTFTSLDLNDPKHDKKNTRCACQTCRRPWPASRPMAWTSSSRRSCTLRTVAR